MFGYAIEENFDAAREERRSRLKWAYGSGLCLLIVWYFISGSSVFMFQVYVLTPLVYGESFYVSRKDFFGESWLWKGALATLPLHIFILSAILELDRVLPSIFTKPMIYVPALFLVYGIEAVLFDKILDRFRPTPKALAEA